MVYFYKRTEEKEDKMSKIEFIKQNKRLLSLFVFLLSCLILVKGTYAWETYSDDKHNQLGSVGFQVDLKELFNPNNDWQPGKTTTKNVYAYNSGNHGAFVRLSLEEFLMVFEMDIEGQAGEMGTGNLLVMTPTPGSDSIKQDDIKTWKADELYYDQITNEYYQGKESVPKTLATTQSGYIYEKDKRERADSSLTNMVLNFGAVKDYRPELTSQYWLYGNDGYFYYSEKLKPGEETSLFLDSTLLKSSTPNQLKKALYKLKVSFEARQSMEQTLRDWGHTSSSDQIYLMLKDKVS